MRRLGCLWSMDGVAIASRIVSRSMAAEQSHPAATPSNTTVLRKHPHPATPPTHLAGAAQRVRHHPLHRAQRRITRQALHRLLCRRVQLLQQPVAQTHPHAASGHPHVGLEAPLRRSARGRRRCRRAGVGSCCLGHRPNHLGVPAHIHRADNDALHSQHLHSNEQGNCMSAARRACRLKGTSAVKCKCLA